MLVAAIILTFLWSAIIGYLVGCMITTNRFLEGKKDEDN